jgi:hypothetical protein
VWLVEAWESEGAAIILGTGRRVYSTPYFFFIAPPIFFYLNRFGLGKMKPNRTEIFKFFLISLIIFFTVQFFFIFFQYNKFVSFFLRPDIKKKKVQCTWICKPRFAYLVLNHYFAKRLATPKIYCLLFYLFIYF